MAGENWTFWLNMTNFALGIVTLLAVVVVIGAVSGDLFFLWLHKVRGGWWQVRLGGIPEM